jgi:RES domain-containing protein
MQAWRLCRSPFADLSGGGARLYGGRWNSAGLGVVYAADSAALSLLEVRVHLDLPPDLLPDDYVLMAIDLSGLPVESLAMPPSDPRAFGDEWLRQWRSAVLRVPSVIVAEGCSLLLNPAHPEATGARVIATRNFTFDNRLFRT